LENWGDLAVFLIICILIPALMYVVSHMIYNRIKNRDELDGLFRWPGKKRKNK